MGTFKTIYQKHLRDAFPLRYLWAYQNEKHPAILPLDFSLPATRIAQVSKLVAKTKGEHRVLIQARQSLQQFKENGTSAAMYGIGRDAETAYKLTRYDSQSGKTVAAITDKNVLAELEAIALLGCLCGPSWANGSSPETFRETLNDACALIDSTSYNERPY